MGNQNIQQPKPNPKGKAIVSIILGIIVTILPFVILIPKLTSPHAGAVAGGILSIFGPLLILAVIVGLIGIILGIIGLAKRNLALIGVVLGVIALLFELLYLFLFLPSPK